MHSVYKGFYKRFYKLSYKATIEKVAPKQQKPSPQPPLALGVPLKGDIFRPQWGNSGFEDLRKQDFPL